MSSDSLDFRALPKQPLLVVPTVVHGVIRGVGERYHSLVDLDKSTLASYYFIHQFGPIDDPGHRHEVGDPVWVSARLVKYELEIVQNDDDRVVLAMTYYPLDENKHMDGEAYEWDRFNQTFDEDLLHFWNTHRNHANGDDILTVKVRDAMYDRLMGKHWRKNSSLIHRTRYRIHLEMGCFLECNERIGF